ncbi:ABC transporter ATP-binding protein [Thermoplasmatota archaeon]
MVSKQVRCPHCENIFNVSGNPGEIKHIFCPTCKIKGKISFKNIEEKNDYAISVKNLKKIYGEIIAVNNISFNVNKGEVFAFLGPNGAGKTTTVEMIESIRKPTNGYISLLGEDIRTSFNDIKEKIGVLPQEFHSFERLTVRETLEYFSKLFQKKVDINDLIKAMNLDDEMNKLYKDLSGGLKQRLGVAVSLVNDPDIIFLDEPTTGLDPKARREVWEVIANLRNKGKTIFLTTHYMEEAEYLADHIAIIHKGKIIAEGTLEDLIRKYWKGSILHLKNCNNPKTINILKEKGYDSFKEENGDLAINIEYKDKILEILSILRYECIDYDSIEIRRPNLEEIFLHLTGAKLSGTAS